MKKPGAVSLPGVKKPIPGKPGIGAQFLSVYFPMQRRIDSIK
jgi:hypothetical protein